MGNKVQPWERQDGESVKAYKAFCIYRDMGQDRTIRRAHEVYADLDENTIREAPPYFLKWSRKFKWVHRVGQYEDHMERIAREAEERAVEGVSTKWAQRLEAMREQEWNLAESLMERALEMLSFPLVRTKESVDGKTIEVYPVDWKLSDVATLAKTASMLGRMAAGPAALGKPEDEEKPKKQIMRIGGVEVEF